MRHKNLVILAILIALALALTAGSCDVTKKRVKLRDLDPKLKQYEGTKWDGLKKEKIRYVVSGSKDVDNWSKQSAVVYASLIQAENVVEIAGKDVEKLKKQKNSAAEKEAEKNVKLAQDILTKAAESAPELLSQGQELANNYKSLIKDATKLPAIASALSDSLSNLGKTIKESPDTIKKLTKVGKQLAQL